MTVDVVEAHLRVVFDDEDACFRPEFAVGDCVDDAAEGEIVVSDGGFGHGVAGARAHRVVRGQEHDREVCEAASLFGVFEFGEELLCAVDIGHSEWEAGCGGANVLVECFDV